MADSETRPLSFFDLALYSSLMMVFVLPGIFPNQSSDDDLISPTISSALARI